MTCPLFRLREIQVKIKRRTWGDWFRVYKYVKFTFLIHIHQIITCIESRNYHDKTTNIVTFLSLPLFPHWTNVKSSSKSGDGLGLMQDLKTRENVYMFLIPFHEIITLIESPECHVKVTKIMRFLCIPWIPFFLYQINPLSFGYTPITFSKKVVRNHVIERCDILGTAPILKWRVIHV